MATQSSSTVLQPIVGSAFNDVIVGTSADNLLTGGAGRDTFVVAPAGGSDVIGDFQIGSAGDILNIRDLGFKSFAGFSAALQTSGRDTILTLADGATLTLKNVAPGDLTPDNVLFSQTAAATATSAQLDAAVAASGRTLLLKASAASVTWQSVDRAGLSLTGTDGADSLQAAIGNTTMIGGKGDDLYTAYNQSTKIVEKAGEGVDTVQTWASSFTLDADQSLENLNLMGTNAANGTGNGLDNVIRGNVATNVLDGAGGNDLLSGGGGRDTFVMRPGSGLDTVADFSAVGSDRDVLQIHGSSFNSFADLAARIVQRGADTLVMLANGDGVVLKNVRAADLTADNFRFVFEGGAGADVMEGGSGNDLLSGGRGRDTFVLSTQSGSDTIQDFTAGSGGDYLKLVDSGFTSFSQFMASARQQGGDVVVTLGNGETLTLGNVDASRLIDNNFRFETSPVMANRLASLSVPVAETAAKSGAATSWISGSTAGTTVRGTIGNDQISAGAANMTLAGGTGDDTYVANATTRIVEAAGQGIDTVQSWYSHVLQNDQSIENLTLMGAGSIDGAGNDLDNIVTGNAAANVLTGGKGRDILTGLGGADTFVVAKSTGAKTITDFTIAGSQADVLQLDGFSSGTFAQLKTRMTQSGADTVIQLDGGDAVILKNIRIGDLSGTNFRLLNVADILTGTAGNDTLNGGDGADILTGGAGRDAFVIAKGNGSDTIIDFSAGTAGDWLDLKGFGFASFSAFQSAMRQSGSDTVVDLGSGETLTLKNTLASKIVAENVLFENVLPASAGSSASVSSSTAFTTVTGRVGNDYLIASAKNVTMVGGAGDDTYVLSHTTDKVVEKTGEGIDTVMTWGNIGYVLPKGQSVENLMLMGSANSSAFGNELNNVVTGNAGENILSGGGGNDIVTGNAGADTFVVVRGEGSDVVTDFSSAQHDVIRLDGFAFKSFAQLASSIQQVGTNAFIALGDGQTLTLQNTVASNLKASDFVFDLDKSAMVQTFKDDFTSFNRFTGTGGTWLTKFEWSGNSAYTLSGNGERHLYVDTDFRGLDGTKSATALGLNPFSVVNGELVITAKPLDASAAAYSQGYKFQSGLITSEAVFAQTYGHFEIKATLPQGAAVWPAFWLLPLDNSWPPELDVLEVFGDEPNSVHHAAHSKNGPQDGGYAMVADLSGSHTYSVNWTPYTLTFFVDGHQTVVLDTPADMNKAMYMLANLAVGGLSGNPEAGLTAQMKIDSITAYQFGDYTLANYTLKTSAAWTNTVTGTSGADSLSGTAGADRIDGRGGADRMTGGDGDDTYVVGHTGAVVVEALGGGIDTVLSSASHTLSANVENLTLTGTDNVSATGNTQSNIIIGNAGDNVVIGGGGNDILTGGIGNDTFVIGIDAGSDIITDFKAGSGAGDVVQFDGSPFTTFDDIKASMTQTGNDVYLKLSSYETLVFRDHRIADFAANDFKLPAAPPVSAGYSTSAVGYLAGNEIVLGTGSNNFLEGKGGTDTLIGGRGNDTYRVTANNPVNIVEAAGEGIDTVEAYTSFTLSDNVENLKLSTWSLTGTGNALANRITGNGGPETLNGKGGNDWLFGGAGNDTFVFEKNSGQDTIADFHRNLGSGEHDLIRFTGYGPAATLSHEGDLWTVHHAGGEDHITLTGVTQLGAGDYVFA